MKVKRPWLVAPRTIEYREEEITLTPDTVLVRHVCTAPSQGTAIHRYRGKEVGLAAYTRQETGGPFPYAWLQGFAYGVGCIEEVGANEARRQRFVPGQLVYTQKLTAEYAVVAPADLTPLPQGLDPESASLMVQAEVGLKGARAVQIILGDTVLVTGQGPIGLFAAQLCKLAGAYRVLATDLSERRLAIARQVGVDLALNAASADTLQRIMEYTGGRGADLVVESSGSPHAFQQGCAAAARFARITVIGWILDPFPFNVSDAFTPKGLEMVVCHSGQSGEWRLGRRGAGTRRESTMQADWQYLMALMNEGKLHAKELITHRFPLSDLVPVWQEFLDRKQDEYMQAVFVS